MEDLVPRVHSALSSHGTSVEIKQQHLADLKHHIKHRQCPEVVIAMVFQIIKVALDTPHLIESAFSIFFHLTRRLTIQENHKQYRINFKLLHRELVKRLGDPKERVRQKATRAMADAWAVSPEMKQDIQDMIIIHLSGKNNPKCKESLMNLISTQRLEHNMPFRRYTPGLVACCEDADGDLRLKAQMTLITLFQNTPDASINDLSTELENFAVRHSIVDHILSEIKASRGIINPLSEATSTAVPSAATSATSERLAVRLTKPEVRSTAEAVLEQRSLASNDATSRHSPPISGSNSVYVPPAPVTMSVSGTNSNFVGALSKTSAPVDAITRDAACESGPATIRPPTSASVTLATPARAAVSASKANASRSVTANGRSSRGMPPEAPAASVLEQESSDISALHFRTSDDLERNINEMLPAFEGRESEANWNVREKRIFQLRRIVRGNSVTTHANKMRLCIKLMLDGIIKAILSLRTTVSTIGCNLVQDFSLYCPSLLEQPAVADLLQHLVKLTGNTKSIIAQKASETVTLMIRHFMLPLQMLKFTESAMQAKIAFTKISACTWLGLIIENHRSGRAKLPGMDVTTTIQAIVSRGLKDSNPTVREEMRPVYWKFAGISSDKSEKIINELNVTQRDLLIKHASNPQGSQVPANAGFASTNGEAGKHPAGLSKRSSVKEAINARRKAAAEGHKPRPQSSIERLDPAPIAVAPPMENLSSRPVTENKPRERKDCKDSKEIKSIQGFGAAPVRLRRTNTDGPRPVEATIPTPVGNSIKIFEDPVDLLDQQTSSIPLQHTANTTKESGSDIINTKDELDMPLMTLGHEENAPNWQRSTSYADVMSLDGPDMNLIEMSPIKQASTEDDPISRSSSIIRSVYTPGRTVPFTARDPMTPLPHRALLDPHSASQSPPGEPSIIAQSNKSNRIAASPSSHKTTSADSATYEHASADGDVENHTRANLRAAVRSISVMSNDTVAKEALAKFPSATLPGPAMDAKDPWRCRKVIDHCIKTLRAGQQLDCFEYRDLHALWPGIPDSVWDSGRRFEALLAALLDNLLKPDTRANAQGHEQELLAADEASNRTSTLEVIQYMVIFNAQQFSNRHDLWSETIFRIIHAYQFIDTIESRGNRKRLSLRICDNVRRLLLEKCYKASTVSSLLSAFEPDALPMVMQAQLHSISYLLKRTELDDEQQQIFAAVAALIGITSYQNRSNNVSNLGMKIMHQLSEQPLFENEDAFWNFLDQQKRPEWAVAVRDFIKASNEAELANTKS